MTANLHTQRAGAAGWILLALFGVLFTTTSLMASMGTEYVVASLTGPAPQSLPPLHLPAGFMREGQVLSLGEEYLFLPGTTVVLADPDTGDFYTVRGPNRITIQKEGPAATDPTGLIRHEKAYFTDPATAVTQIARLLVDENWLGLTLYYDLTGTGISPVSLLSGAFFKRAHPPEISHPAIIGGIIQPFSPQFSYRSHHTEADNKVRVTVQISIDQGGGMMQEGRDTFTLRKSAKGYQLLPKEIPASAAGS